MKVFSCFDTKYFPKNIFITQTNVRFSIFIPSFWMIIDSVYHKSQLCKKQNKKRAYV